MKMIKYSIAKKNLRSVKTFKEATVEKDNNIKISPELLCAVAAALLKVND